MTDDLYYSVSPQQPRNLELNYSIDKVNNKSLGMLVKQLCFPVAGLYIGYPLKRYPLASKIYIRLNNPPLQISKYICIIELRMVFHLSWKSICLYKLLQHPSSDFNIKHESADISMITRDKQIKQSREYHGLMPAYLCGF